MNNSKKNLRSLHIITSTINIPYFLVSILENARKYKEKNFKIFVIGDLKTPKEAKSYCEKLSKKYNSFVKYLSVSDQEKLLKKYPLLVKFIPKNDNVRKMIGNIICYLDQCKNVLMIDDDNYAIKDHNLIHHHSNTGFYQNKISSMSSDNKWPNIAIAMEEKNNIPFYPRGFPWSKRFLKNKIKKKIEINKKIAVTGGLVLGDPDIDSVSRLFWPINITKIKKNFLPNFAVGKNNYSPFNDQNTSISRDLIPIYYKPPAGGRNSDIWSSYFIEKILHSTKDNVVAFGEPLVNQIRNEHDYQKDYELEKDHIRANEIFVEVLIKQKIKFTNYLDTATSLCKKSLKEINKIKFKGDKKFDNPRHYQQITNTEKYKNFISDKKFIESYFKDYLQWLKIIKKYFGNTKV
tara:strand:+ start:53 stop:1267 length:1215 start_codon:yes stop_codon:yes gene_type:complete